MLYSKGYEIIKDLIGFRASGRADVESPGLLVEVTKDNYEEMKGLYKTSNLISFLGHPTYDDRRFICPAAQDELFCQFKWIIYNLDEMDKWCYGIDALKESNYFNDNRTENKMKKIAPLVLATSLFFVAGQTLASAVYTYTGNSLTGFMYGNNVGKYYDPITARFEISDDGTQILDWQVSQAQVGTLSLSDMLAQEERVHPSQFANEFQMTTDANGNPLTWDMSMVGLQEIVQTREGYLSNATYFTMESDRSGRFSDSVTHFDYTPYPEFLAVNYNQGTWTVENGVENMNLNDVDYYNIPAVPEPETYAMLLAGLGLVGFSMKRRNKDTLAAV